MVTHLKLSSKVERNEGYPYDARDVHTKANKLCFIKVGWNIPSVDSIESAYRDQEEDKSKWTKDTISGNFATQLCSVECRVGYLKIHSARVTSQ